MTTAPITSTRRIKHVLVAAAPAILIPMASAIWCWWATGSSLGLFLGMPLLVSCFLPALTLANSGRDRLLAALCCLVGPAMIWALAAGGVQLTAWQWLRCCIVLGAYVAALGGLAGLLAAARLPAAIAASLALLIGMLWLTWPVWLSHGLSQRLVEWLVPLDPLMAINSVVKHLGSWDRAPIAYRTLTVLNQDVSYALPSTIAPMVAIHALIGAPGWWLTLRRGSARQAVVTPAQR